MITPRFSWYQIAVLKRLVSGPIPLEELCQLDQRPMEALFQRGMFQISARLSAQITNGGWETYRTLATSKPRKRLDQTRPVFKSARGLMGESVSEKRKRRKA